MKFEEWKHQFLTDDLAAYSAWKEVQTLTARVEELEATSADDHTQIISLQAACDRYRAALEQIRDGLANTPNPDCSPFVTESIDALYHYACNALKG